MSCLRLRVVDLPAQPAICSTENMANGTRIILTRLALTEQQESNDTFLPSCLTLCLDIGIDNHADTLGFGLS